MSQFDELGAVPPQALAPGYLARAVHGEQLTLAVVEIEANAALPEHHHANEQFGIVLRGTVLFRIGDEERQLSPGDIWRIPSDVPHRVTGGPDGAEVIDVFGPPREDWKTIEQHPVRPPAWPRS